MLQIKLRLRENAKKLAISRLDMIIITKQNSTHGKSCFGNCCQVIVVEKNNGSSRRDTGWDAMQLLLKAVYCQGTSTSRTLTHLWTGESTRIKTPENKEENPPRRIMWTEGRHYDC